MSHAQLSGGPVSVVAHPLTLEDYLAMPDDGHRYEIVDGQPVMVPAPVNPHQRAIARLLRLLDDAAPDGYEVLPSPVDWVLWQAPTLQVRQPDLVVVSNEQASSPRLTTPPLLVVEILSPESFERDVVTKRREYATAGAGHYWVIDLARPEVIGYAERGGRLVEHVRATGGDVFSVAEPFPVAFRPADLARVRADPG